MSTEYLVEMDLLQPNQVLPLVVRPITKQLKLLDLAQDHAEWLDRMLRKHGGILFRGFNIRSSEQFKQFASTICANLQMYANFYKPGQVIGNSRTAVTSAPEKKITWHNEDNFNKSTWPMKIMFYCMNPAKQGGETPIVDCRTIYNRMDPNIRHHFIEKGLMYVDNYLPLLGVSWQKFFGTTDKEIAEEYCRKVFMQYEWLEDGGLRTRCIRPAIVCHPNTGEKLWFNVAHVYHPSCRDPQERETLLTMLPADKFPTNVYYGDGSPIEESVIKGIFAAYERAEVTFSWQSGDVLVLDNMLVAHGRNPFVGKREHFAAMGEGCTYWNLLAEGAKPNPELILFLKNIGIQPPAEFAPGLAAWARDMLLKTTREGCAFPGEAVIIVSATGRALLGVPEKRAA